MSRKKDLIRYTLRNEMQLENCLRAIDGRTKVCWDYKDILRGHLRTMDIWVKQGLIKI